MKEALKFGFEHSIDHYPDILKKTIPFFLTFFLSCFLQAILLMEISLWIGNLLGMSSFTSSIVSFFTQNTGSITDKLVVYVSQLQNIFKDLVILNTFMVGIYYVKVGFFRSNKTLADKTVLDSPLDNHNNSIAAMLFCLDGHERKSYFIGLSCYLLYLNFTIFGQELIYSLHHFIAAFYNLVSSKIPFVLLIYMYSRATAANYWLKKDWLITLLICVFLMDNVDAFLYWNLPKLVGLVINFFIATDLLQLNILIGTSVLLLCSIIWIPFVSMFFSTTFSTLKNADIPQA